MNLANEESTQLEEKLPRLLEYILKITLLDEKSSEIAQTDIFIILIIILLSENGFLLMDNNNTIDIQCREHVHNISFSKWKTSTGVYKLTFVLRGFNDVLIKFVMSAFGTSSLINVVLSDLKPEVYSVCFPVNRYIVDTKANVPMMFSDLKHLTDTFKNKIVTPVKSAIMNCYGYSGASLIGLPEELVFNILLNLPVCDIINVAKTCKKFNLLLNNESFWHKLFLRDFPLKVSIIDCPEWKSSYRRIYEAHQESLHRVRNLRSSMMDLRDLYDYTGYMHNPIMDII